MNLSTGDFLKAKRLRAEGMPWATIAQQIGCPVDRIRRVLDPDWLAHRLEMRRKRRQRNPEYDEPYSRVLKKKDSGKRLIVPAEVMAERDRIAALQYRPLTAILLGDPPPGRSALDKRNGMEKRL